MIGHEIYEKKREGKHRTKELFLTVTLVYYRVELQRILGNFSVFYLFGNVFLLLFYYSVKYQVILNVNK